MSEPVNGKEFVPVRIRVCDQLRPKGWFEVRFLGIRPDQATEWAALQIQRWNLANPKALRQILKVQVWKGKRWGPPPRAQQ